MQPVTSAFADSATAAFSSDDHGSSGSPSSSRSAQHQQRQQPVAGSPMADAGAPHAAARAHLLTCPPGVIDLMLCCKTKHSCSGEFGGCGRLAAA